MLDTKHYISGDIILVCLLSIFVLQVIMFGVFSRDAFKLGKDVGVLEEKVGWVEDQILTLRENKNVMQK